MLLLIVECAPAKIHGYCSSWGLQVSGGVYVAQLPANIREEIWGQLVQWARADTRITMVWDSPVREQGVEWRAIGNPRRVLSEIEGLIVSSWIPQAASSP